jgi:hypothetical protein
VVGRRARLSVTVMVLATACGRGDSKDPAASPIATVKPCALVTSAQVSAAIGSPVGKPVAVPGANVPGEQACQFLGANSQKAAFKVNVGILDSAPIFARAVFDKYKAEHGSAAPVPRLGTEAVWSESSGGGLLIVITGDDVVTVEVFGVSVADALGPATALATTALDRL